MSRSRPVLRNPAVRRFQWKASTGELSYWDREKEARVLVALPFEFMPLDQLATVAGFYKPQKANFYSNEVRDHFKEPFEVKVKGAVFERGFYRELKCLANGAGYAQSIYLAFKLDGEWRIGNFLAAGSSRGAWFDYTKLCGVPENGKTIMTKGEQEESPMGPYFPPAFKYDHVTTEESEAAWKLDDELQQFLDQALAPATRSRTAQADDAEGVPGSAVVGEPTVAGFDPDEPVTLDDIPF